MFQISLRLSVGIYTLAFGNMTLCFGIAFRAKQYILVRKREKPLSRRIPPGYRPR